MSTASIPKLGGARDNMEVYVIEIEYEGIQDVSVSQRE